MLENRKIEILDSTLREGEQTPGVLFTLNEKLDIAKKIDLFGVDLTEKGIETTKKRLDLYNLKSNLRRIDAESLPFEDNYFDIVYSWGVIHHSEDTEKISKKYLEFLSLGENF